MTIQVALHHQTTYRYERPIELGPQIVRLRPAPHCRTRVLSYSLEVSPKEHFINWQQDPFSNWQARFVFPEKTDHLVITVDLVAEMAVLNPFDFFVEPGADTFPFPYAPELKRDLAPFLEVEPAGSLLAAYLAAIDRTPVNTVDFIVELNRRLQGEIAYTIRLEPGIQTPEETLEKRSGSCRDSAWLLVQILRRLGLAARFVSGYLIQLKADQKSLDGPSGSETDFTDLHAWCEVYLPGGGWIGLDPTSGLLAGEGHLPIAATPHPSSAAPVTGNVEPADVEFDFAMRIERIKESPRVTLPYTDSQWAAIDGLGEAIDARLVKGDVRLTMGGEPTFVAIDDRDGAEWSTEAVGPAKRRLADDLIKRLQKRFAPSGLLHHGQGKWYPGEQLPRWAFALHWRRDGVPLWQDTSLIAAEVPEKEAGIAEAEAFARALCRSLAVDESCAQAAYEDPAHFLLKEEMLPANVDPIDNKLSVPEERARLAKVFKRGLDTPAGFVLPLQAWQAKAVAAEAGRPIRWKSERWKTRRGQLFLLPGDSPVGFRLPLGSLDHIDADGYPRVVPLDPFAAHAALPARNPEMQRRLPEQAVDGEPGEAKAGQDEAVRTALSIEARDGKVCVFMPPTASVDEFVDLVMSIERTAAALSQPVHVEGYPPPPDPRIETVKVTPDPGVIEVNIQPARSWRELEWITTTLYDEARQARLDTAKFMLDGRPAGTGGGNHVVVGGPTAPDSPFLRRPDLLASLIRYWQNHPSLSYLFSGLFIGPTSQAPRVDEARDDQLHELEIALRQIPDPMAEGAKDCPPWLVDRILRNLLVDLTGNTHRAEICIDKLYSPDGPTGRLGLVEFRAFEMPPHPRMSLAQQLLLRALIAWFWERPYTSRLVPFGTGLHDRFMLPWFVWQDFQAVARDLSGAGMPVDPAWFQPHLEFRFPVYGSFAEAGIEVEVRAALEPWHVMGEEGVVGGTARYVDSSLERLQVMVRGDIGERHLVTCNGFILPLVEVGPGERVSGVRFRAWQPPSCLHPTIGVHSPLVLDLVDTASAHAIAGCTYHVMHPAGRNYETMPVNDFEAQGRRLSRFQIGGHTTGRMLPRQPVRHPAFPHTLDLRLQQG